MRPAPSILPDLFYSSFPSLVLPSCLMSIAALVEARPHLLAFVLRLFSSLGSLAPSPPPSQSSLTVHASSTSHTSCLSTSSLPPPPRLFVPLSHNLAQDSQIFWLWCYHRHRLYPPPCPWYRGTYLRVPWTCMARICAPSLRLSLQLYQF